MDNNLTLSYACHTLKIVTMSNDYYDDLLQVNPIF